MRSCPRCRPGRTWLCRASSRCPSGMRTASSRTPGVLISIAIQVRMGCLLDALHISKQAGAQLPSIMLPSTLLHVSGAQVGQLVQMHMSSMQQCAQASHRLVQSCCSILSTILQQHPPSSKSTRAGSPAQRICCTAHGSPRPDRRVLESAALGWGPPWRRLGGGTRGDGVDPVQHVQRARLRCHLGPLRLGPAADHLVRAGTSDELTAFSGRSACCSIESRLRANCA